MSAFAVSITPTRVKKKPPRNENREPVPVVMAPFSGKSIVVFEDVPVSKTAKRVLVVTNPTDEQLEVILTKPFRPELNISVAWQRNEIPPQGSTNMELVWTPLEAIASSESIQLTDNRNFRKDVNVVLKSISKLPGNKSGASRYPSLSSGPAKQPPKMFKSASSHTITNSTMRSQPLSKISKSDMNISKPTSRNDGRSHNPAYFERGETIEAAFSPKVEEWSAGKENVSPETPKNASDLFDKFKFTPATETKSKQTSNLEILSSMPTPVFKTKSEKKSVDEDEGVSCGINPRRLVDNMVGSAEKPGRQETPRKPCRWTPKIVRHSCTPSPTEKHAKESSQSRFDPAIVSTASKRVTPERSGSASPQNISEGRRKLFSNQTTSSGTINKTFEVPSKSTDSLDSGEGSSEDVLAVINKTATISTSQSRILSIIVEEEKIETTKQIYEKTFDMPDEQLLRDVHLVGTPLRKVSESMKDISSKKLKIATQGSMPNLNEMEAIKSIEQNRYYLPIKSEIEDSPEALNTSYESIRSIKNTISTQELLFDQHEILAQSSRFNVHESTTQTNRRKPTLDLKFKPQIKTEPEDTQRFPKRARESSLDSPVTDNFLSVGMYTQGTCFISVSPPKRSRMELANERPGTKVRVTKWSATQPKKLKLIRPQNSASKAVLTRPRVKLYDSEMYLQPFINPDAFAATTTFDPFLASTMYLDDHAIKRHEEQLKKWLNALVALPAELDTDCNKKIDVGNLFNVVRNQELMLAPTKEELSMNYLTKSKMDFLRKSAVNLYMSAEMIEICSKVAIYINKNSIQLRKDRDLHLDVVLQRYILELLLSFNPLWLRLGLEVVFGEVIHLHSNSDIVGLSTFILNRLFRDRLVEQKHSRAYILSERYCAYIKKFTLQKFLLLLLFLDKAKNKKIIKHNPCLFVSNAKYKETKEILQRFSSELLANIGDITRNLRRLGYVLTHKQTYIDEFNYAFNNLAIDLRDGVRLARVMEIILLREDLTSQLRVPAISRTQKAFNVNLSLKALAEANFTLTGGIAAYDIVDGHREKTLSLLWQLIYKFRSPKFHAAATVIQRWWRNYWLKVVIMRRIRIKIENRRNDAATKIQSMFRGYMSRIHTTAWKKQRIANVLILQKYVRGFLCRRRFERALTKVVLIQRWYRAVKKTKAERIRYLLTVTSTVRIQTWYRRIILSRKLRCAAVAVAAIKKQAKLEHNKAIIIQRVWKSVTIRRKFRMIVHQVVRQTLTQKLEYKSAVRIQSFFQMIRFRREYTIKKETTIKIQRAWRLYRLTREIRTLYIRQRFATISIQRYFRGYLAMKTEKKKYQTIRSSAIKIQRKFRATQMAELERRRFLLLREATAVIQRRLRATLLMRRQRQEYLQLQSSIKIIQQRYRALLLMRKCRESYLTMKSSTIKIQRKFRATLLAREVRMRFISMQYHAIIIQQRLRANRLMKLERAKYLKVRNAVICIQRQLRATLLMHLERQRFTTLKSAAVILQDRFRALLKMRRQRQEFLVLKSATITVQQQFRATQLMRRERSEFLRLKKASECIQRYYRATAFMRLHRLAFLKQKHAAKVLQERYRAQMQMRECRTEYMSLKRAAITIQRRFRATRLMKRGREEYIRLRNIVVYIQCHYRAKLLMRPRRSEFLELKAAAITLQSHIRANFRMKHQRRQFLSLKHAVINVQRRFRARRSMKLALNQYTECKMRTIVIQRFIRNYYLMRNIRQTFVLQRNSTIKIQRWWRSSVIQRQERATYLKTIKAVHTIQIRWRATLQMRIIRRKYVEIRRCIVRIQTLYRSYLLMKSIRTNYILLRQAAVATQRRFRAKQKAIEHRSHFLVMKSAAVRIQQWFRSIRITKIVREHYLQLRQTTIFIQQKYRARNLARVQHEAYKEIRHVTLNLQCRIRGVLARKRFNDLLTPERREAIRRRKAARVIQKFWRGYVVRKRWHSAQFQLMRKRIRELKLTSKPANTVRQQIISSIQMLKRRYSITELLSILIRLENLSRVVPHTLKDHAVFIASFSYGIMAQANRSEPDKQVIELCSRIILNFARYGGTKEDVFQESGLVTIAQMLLRWSDKDCPIFNTLCTLVWVFIHSEEKKKVIYNFMTTRESAFMVRETKKLVLRKKKMLMHSRKLNHNHQQQSNSPKNSRNNLPQLDSDFGVARKSPYIFNCPVFALDTVLSLLNITV